jgi:enamine deaminase RidA (YjgF/YER057c/UK114 family)
MLDTSLKAVRVKSPDVPEPEPGLWSNAKKVGNLVFISGLVALDENGEVIGMGDTYVQTKAIFAKIGQLMKAAGGSINDVMKITVYLTDIRNRPAVLKARREIFSGDFPCSTLVCVSALFDPRVSVEIDAIGVVGSSPV